MSSRRRIDSRHPNISVRDAVRTVLSAVPAIRRYRDLAAKLPNFDIRCFDDLAIAARDATTALEYYEERRVNAAMDARDLADTATAARAARTALRRAITPLVDGDLIAAASIASIEVARSQAGLVIELRALCAVFVDHRIALCGKTAVTDEQLGRAQVLAGRLEAASRPRRPSELDLATEHRNVVFHRFATRYAEVRRAIEFLRPRDVELNRIAPPLRGSHARSAVPRAA